MPTLWLTKITVIINIFIVYGSFANAQNEVCIKNYIKSTDARNLGFSPSEIENLVFKITNAHGLSSQGIRVIPCDGVDQVQSVYIGDKVVPVSDYILYDPIWVRQVISNSSSQRARDESTFLFSHELGHLFNRHFTSNLGLSTIVKEIEADRFAGCVTGALNADWDNISSFISRVRLDTESTHPTRTQSLEVVKAQFNICHARGAELSKRFNPNGSGPSYSPPKLNGRTLDGCLMSPDHPSGDDCSVSGTLAIASAFCKVAGYSAAEDVHTVFFNQRQASYKLTEKLILGGSRDLIWNEDDGGGFEVASLRCKNFN